MDIYEQLPILLKIESDDKEIKLRLDENGLGSFNSGKKSIQEIILSGCKVKKELIDRFQELIAEVFEYEVFEQDNKTVFQFWGDYGRIEDEIECESFTETFSEYTKVDLIQKGVALNNLYVDLHKRFSINSAINTQLRDKLKFEIKNETERSQRKIEFFEAKDKSKSEALKSEIKVLRKLQKILNEDSNY
jgi:hypothetical protein